MGEFLGRTVNQEAVSRIVASHGGGDTATVLKGIEKNVFDTLKAHVRQFETQQAIEAAGSDFNV